MLFAKKSRTESISPAEAARMRVASATKALEDAETGLLTPRQAVAERQALLDSDSQLVAAITAERDAAIADAPNAKRAGRPVADIASIDDRLKQAQLERDASAQLLAETKKLLEAADDRVAWAREDFYEAIKKVAQFDLADALTKAAKVDQKLADLAGSNYGVARIESAVRIDAEAPTERMVEVGRWNPNGNDFRAFRLPVDSAIREVASGSYEFAQARDERRYAKEVAAAREEIEARKSA